MRTVAVIPAFNNEKTIAETVRALKEPRVTEVVVVDDGSADGTAAVAASAGARVIRLSRNRGKHAALETGMAQSSADVLLMVDADTGSSASEVLYLAEAVWDGKADMAIGVLPSAGSRGGFGTIKRLAAWMLLRATGEKFAAPLSGQRALTAAVFEACRPFAKGFAVDAALTADAVLRGFEVIEMEVAIEHDHRGRSIGGFAHRARQGVHILMGLTPRVFARNRYNR